MHCYYLMANAVEIVAKNGLKTFRNEFIQFDESNWIVWISAEKWPVNYNSECNWTGMMFTKKTYKVIVFISIPTTPLRTSTV